MSLDYRCPPSRPLTARRLPGRRLPGDRAPADPSPRQEEKPGEQPLRRIPPEQSTLSVIRLPESR